MKTLALVFGLPILWLLGSEYFHYVWGQGATLKESYEISGTFGDSFGVLTAIFSGLAAYLVFLTLRAQKIELNLTRGELRDTRDHQILNSIEVTFYKLVELHHTNLSTVQQRIKTETLEGRTVIDRIEEVLRRHYQNEVTKMNASGTAINRPETGSPWHYKWIFLLNETQQSELIKDLKDRLNYYISSQLGGYIKHLIVIIKFLENNKATLGEKTEFYIDILRAQLTNNEQKLLLYASYLVKDSDFKKLRTSKLLNEMKEEDFLFDIKDLKVSELLNI